MTNTLDLRHLATAHESTPGKLAAMSKTYLNIDMENGLLITAPNFESNVLGEEHIRYAALTVHVSIELFKWFASQHAQTKQMTKFNDYFKNYLNIDYRKEKPKITELKQISEIKTEKTDDRNMNVLSTTILGGIALGVGFGIMRQLFSTDTSESEENTAIIGNGCRQIVDQIKTLVF